MRISVSATINAPLATVWQAYVTPADIIQWNAASDDWHTTSASVDLRVGGIFSSRMEAKDGSAGFDFTGTYTTIVEHELIEYVFGERTASVRFTPTNGVIQVHVELDAEDENDPESQRAGWQAILDNFARYVTQRGM
ncbi:MAG: SRPBCC domain-containing protein [Bradyrhizobiaceae bacterium]|nr:SRPBCC domain-containing protein [Bradyrhizobiaceae bacterium]